MFLFNGLFARPCLTNFSSLLESTTKQYCSQDELSLFSFCGLVVLPETWHFHKNCYFMVQFFFTFRVELSCCETVSNSFCLQRIRFLLSEKRVLLINGLIIVMIARKTEVHWLWAIDDVLNCVAYVKWNICNRIWHYLWYMIHMCWKFIVVKMPIVSIVRRSIYLSSQPGNNEHWLFN